MAVKERIKALVHHKRGDAAVEIIPTAAMLILIFAVLVSAMIYVTQYYNASYICRRAVRTIEVQGEYNEQSIHALANELGGNNLSGLRITVTASYKTGHKIQLRNEFTVKLEAYYPIKILMLGQDYPLELQLPIKIKLSGRSEVYWK